MSGEPEQPFLDLAMSDMEGGQQPFFAAVRAQRSAKQVRDASIADMVHYQAADEECWAAMVTATDPFSDIVAVTAFPASTDKLRTFAGVAHDEGREAGTWHWGHE